MQPYRSIDDVFAAGQRAIAKKATDKELAGYLDAFVQGRLTTGTPEAVPSYEAQRDRLVDIVRKQYADGFGYHQTVNGEIVGVPKFFEVVLSMALVAHEIELVNIYYEKEEIAAGISTARKIPCAEFVVTSDELKERVDAPDKPATPTALPDIVSTLESPPVAISLLVEDRIIYAKVDNKVYRISRRLRSGMPPFLFINHAISHPRTIISRHDIKDKTGSSDITELIRGCGFDKELKAVFFPDTTEQVVCFDPAPALTQKRLKLLKNHKWDKVRKGGKT